MVSPLHIKSLRVEKLFLSVSQIYRDVKKPIFHGCVNILSKVWETNVIGETRCPGSGEWGKMPQLRGVGKPDAPATGGGETRCPSYGEWGKMPQLRGWLMSKTLHTHFSHFHRPSIQELSSLHSFTFIPSTQVLGCGLMLVVTGWNLCPPQLTYQFNEALDSGFQELLSLLFRRFGRISHHPTRCLCAPVRYQPRR